MKGFNAHAMRNVMFGNEAIYELGEVVEIDRKARTKWVLTLI